MLIIGHQHGALDIYHLSREVLKQYAQPNELSESSESEDEPEPSGAIAWLERGRSRTEI